MWVQMSYRYVSITFDTYGPTWNIPRHLDLEHLGDVVSQAILIAILYYNLWTCGPICNTPNYVCILWDPHDTFRFNCIRLVHVGLLVLREINIYLYDLLDMLTYNYNVSPTTYNIYRSVACGSTCPKGDKYTIRWL